MHCDRFTPADAAAEQRRPFFVVVTGGGHHLDVLKSETFSEVGFGVDRPHTFHYFGVSRWKHVDINDNGWTVIATTTGVIVIVVDVVILNVYFRDYYVAHVRFEKGLFFFLYLYFF